MQVGVSFCLWKWRNLLIRLGKSDALVFLYNIVKTSLTMSYIIICIAAENYLIVFLVTFNGWQSKRFQAIAWELNPAHNPLEKSSYFRSKWKPKPCSSSARRYPRGSIAVMHLAGPTSSAGCIRGLPAILLFPSGSFQGEHKGTRESRAHLISRLQCGDWKLYNTGVHEYLNSAFALCAARLSI